MDKTLAWLWLADAVGSGCQYAQELLTLYPDPAELYDALRAGTEAPPACLTPTRWHSCGIRRRLTMRNGSTTACCRASIS